jgi:hypothetical protein
MPLFCEIPEGLLGLDNGSKEVLNDNGRANGVPRWMRKTREEVTGSNLISSLN